MKFFRGLLSVIFLSLVTTWSIAGSLELNREDLNFNTDLITLENGISFQIPKELLTQNDDLALNKVLKDVPKLGIDPDGLGNFKAGIYFKLKPIMEIRITPFKENNVGQKDIENLSLDQLKKISETRESILLETANAGNYKIKNFSHDRIKVNDNVFIAFARTRVMDQSNIDRGQYTSIAYSFNYYSHLDSFNITTSALIGLHAELEDLTNNLLSSLEIPME